MVYASFRLRMLWRHSIAVSRSRENMMKNRTRSGRRTRLDWLAEQPCQEFNHVSKQTLTSFFEQLDSSSLAQEKTHHFDHQLHSVHDSSPAIFLPANPTYYTDNFAIMGKVHGSLARAGKVKSQTPKGM